MKYPTDAMVLAGNEMAAMLTTASIQKEMFNEDYHGDDELVAAYVLDDIDSVTAIYLAMERAKDEHRMAISPKRTE